MKTRSILILIFVIALLGGFIYIILTNRAIDQLNSSPEASQPQDLNESDPAENVPTENTEANVSSGTYAMSEVSSHKTESDCWTAINGTVYDLSSWVSRHPGGPAAIIGLCGTDGSAAFTKQHGNAPKPQSALALLKIGNLQ